MGSLCRLANGRLDSPHYSHSGHRRQPQDTHHHLNSDFLHPDWRQAQPQPDRLAVPPLISPFPQLRLNHTAIPAFSINLSSPNATMTSLCNYSHPSLQLPTNLTRHPTGTLFPYNPEFYTLASGLYGPGSILAWYLLASTRPSCTGTPAPATAKGTPPRASPPTCSPWWRTPSSQRRISLCKLWACWNGPPRTGDFLSEESGCAARGAGRGVWPYAA